MLTPTEEVSHEKADSFRELIASLGALPVILSYEEHDRVVAAISHLPHLISASLVNLVHDSDNERHLMKTVAAGGFRDITRISSSSPEMWREICLANGEAILPLLDLEKFTYAAFSDTEPTLFVFASFFFLAAFICTKSLKSVARCADLCLFLFLIPFCALLAMGAFKADFSHLLPLFGTPLEGTMSAFTHTIPHFSDLTMLLPLLFFYHPRRGEEKKILLGYGVGALCTLAFLAVFFGLYASLAPREHYAFSKIAQYFPALSVIGRLDLFFVYLISIVLLFFTCLPLQYATELVCATFSLPSRNLVAAAVNVAAFFFTLFCNKYYDSIYALFCKQLPIIFVLFSYLPPIFACFLPKDSAKDNPKNGAVKRAKNAYQKENDHA
jgi:hypothetical protein